MLNVLRSLVSSCSHGLLGSKRRARQKPRARIAPVEPMECRVLLSAPPVVTSLTQDAGTYATVRGTVTNDGSVINLPVDIDENGDGIVDNSIATDIDGTFSYSFSPQYAQGTFKARAVDADGAGAWFSLPLKNDPAVVNGLSLQNDTGVSSTDGITYDGTVQGTITNEEPVTQVSVEIDWNGDGATDDATITDANGYFFYDATPHLPAGPVTVSVRAVEYAGAEEIDSAWVSLSFEIQNDPPVVAGLTLANDTGTSSTDGVTTDGTVTGTVTNDGTVTGLTVEFDLDGDGFADDFTFTDGSGNFTYDPTSMLPTGQVTVQARAVEYDPVSGTPIEGDWVALSFQLEAPANDPPVVTGLSLLNDTGTSSTDGITSDGTITGTVTDDGSVSGLMVEIDLDGDGLADDYTYTDGSGNFTYDSTPFLAQGSVTLHVRAVEWDDALGQYVYGDWVTLTFTYEETTP